jgi:ribosomal protein L7/L12
MADVLAWFGLISVALLFLALLWLSQLLGRTRRLSRMEAKLDMLLHHAGISYDPYKSLPPGVAQALQRGDKIGAIKEYREATGADLVEAKEFIEEAQRRLTPSA